jgi:type II secretory pathway pseudopilin PulG
MNCAISTTLSSRPRRINSSTRVSQRGYVLITLILFVALLAIAMTALAPVISQQIKRDREEELVHRGTQYSRAIKHYMKKLNKYPNSIEDLENTNNIRYLRKRYKDPITGKDFKLLHMGEVQSLAGAALAGANPAASLAAGAAGAALAGGNTSAFGGSGVFGGGNSGGFGGNSGGGFGNSGGGFAGTGGGFGNSGGGFAGAGGGFGNSGGGFAGTGGGFGGNSGGVFGGNSGSGFGNSSGQNSTNTPGASTDPSQQQGASGTPQGQGGFGQAVQSLPGFGQQNGGNQLIGGGPVVGVASLSKDKSIRVFSKKDHYKDWQFIYDPTSDRGGLITTPYQTPTITASQSITGASGANGTPGAPGTQQGAPASPFGFGGGQQNAPGGFGGQQPQAPQAPPNQGPQ